MTTLALKGRVCYGLPLSGFVFLTLFCTLLGTCFFFFLLFAGIHFSWLLVAFLSVPTLNSAMVDSFPVRIFVPFFFARRLRG